MSQLDKILRIVQGVHIQDMNKTANQLLCIFEKKLKTCEKAAIIENAFVPVIAYLEWCGIRLDITKWKKKMEDKIQHIDRAALGRRPRSRGHVQA